MSFSNRLIIFFFGIFIGIFLIRFIFPSDKISKITQGYVNYFKGHDKIINFLIHEQDLKKEVESVLDLSEEDTLFYYDLIQNSDLKIISRKPCFQYLLKPNEGYSILELLIEKCEKKVSLIRFEFKKD